MASTAKLTPTMRAAIAYIEGVGGRLMRYQGGFWARPEWNWRDRHFGTGTVAALVTRGLAKYTAFRTGRGGTFPIELQLITTKETEKMTTTKDSAVIDQSTIASENRDFLRMARREHAKSTARMKVPYAAVLRLLILDVVESAGERDLDPHIVY